MLLWQPVRTVVSARSSGIVRVVRLVVARCSVDYSGRLDVHLDSAIRLLIVKADGSLSIHSEFGVKSLNWMSAPRASKTGR